ncbi:MAG: acetate kinase [Bacilli bacterium]|nr:acetate kinase [Bacilli bacterium]
MSDKYLVINCGSSSLKFSLYEMPNEIEIISGYVEKIGYEDSFWTIKINGNKKINKKYLKDHLDAVNIMIDELINNKIITSLEDIKGIGHRVLHGGEYYDDSVEINDIVLEKIISLTNLGPLHLPGQIAGIKAMKECIPNVKQVAVFDTAFHQTMPKENYLYALPYEWYTEYGIRKYGFHGISHKYITEVMKGKLNKEDVNLIICHVGSGASISCIKNGKCYDTSMGLTPLDGLIMGTRCGNIDPSIIEFMINNSNMELDEVMNNLNKESGLLGICGKNDFRDVVSLKNNNNERSILAYNMFMDSIIKYISEYYFELEGDIDAIVFTAGVLENNIKLREDIINKLSIPMNISINSDINNNIGYGCELKEGVITSNQSKIPVYVIPTSEEVMIVKDTYNIINNN